MNSYSPSFLRAANFVMNPMVEGELSLDAGDPGNWTGGKVGDGEMVGTKYGISAATYPQLDIKSLNREQAVAIYWRDFWMPGKLDQLPPRLAMTVFDCAVNQGPQVAAKLLQRSVGVDEDGAVGPVTVAAARAQDQDETIPEFLSFRAMRYTSTKGAAKNLRGWLKRCIRVGIESSR